MDTQETIAAPATAPGEGGIGIVRISGARAEELISGFFRPFSRTRYFESHRLYYGHFLAADREVIDEVMVVIMRGPKSYTREDVAEVHCHGGSLSQRRILDCLIDGGARLARPGEFTLRAFLNGRIDLTQAEAVIDLIRARSESAGKMALGQLEGRLSSTLFRFRDQLADILALIEAHVDFPEEDIETPVQNRLLSSVDSVTQEISALIETFDSGRILREGLAVLILGRPNVGKSSLLNALLGETRAIVTDIAGTTRDTIEENLVLGGIPLRLIDTAGIRDSLDPVESEGVRRARGKAESADLVLLVVDGSVPTHNEDLQALEICRDSRVVLVVNKIDIGCEPLDPFFGGLPVAPISAHTGRGLDNLRQMIVSFFLDDTRGEGRESIMVSDRRHREALIRCRTSLERFSQAMQAGSSSEFLAFELREALDALGQITGDTTPDDILERIFLRFCIGK